MGLFCFPWQLLILSFTVFFARDVHAKCLEDQQSMLLQLKQSLTYNASHSSKLVFWNSSTDCCTWAGVTCSSGHVIALDLNNESISGGINSSSSLFDLQYLQSLNLADNSFNGAEIPPGIGKLANLTYLNMANAGFSGQIPTEISSLKKLVSLDISNFNWVLGILPLKLENPNLRTLVQNLSSLEEIYLDGVIVSAHGYEWCQALSSSLPNLRVLSLSNCKLSGRIDSSLAKLRSLSVIILDYNDVFSPVPEFFLNFTNLTVLSIASSGLKGSFPAEIFQIPTLQTIDLSTNELLKGFLPEFLPQNSSLQTMVLSSTNFSGKLPDSIHNLKMMSTLDLYECNFSGFIPSSVGNLTQLDYLDLSFNMFTGPVPFFHLSKNLRRINLNHNNLKGQIHSIQWEGFLKLLTLDLSYNSLSGSIPLSLFSLPLLQRIQLSYNQFAGPFNEFLNASSCLLTTLDLSMNKLEGPIPVSVFELRGLDILILSYNNFSGTVDLSMIENLKNLVALDISFNKLSLNMSGNNFASSAFPQFTMLKLASCMLEVFPNLKNQSRLATLDLSNNQIRGEIPTWLWNNGNVHLNQVNLSHNMLVGFEKPLPNASLDLSILDLHSNLLQGQIPILTSSATFLDYSSNNFSSFIPDNIGYNIPYTLFFSLSNNSLSGTIPESICSASYLEVLDLSFNGLSGTIPPCLLQLDAICVLDLRKNKLAGPIPDTFPSKCNLQTLDLNDNLIDASVPRTLANCNTLEVLDLGNNQISDAFPLWLEHLSTLRVLVLRSNRFYGPIQCPESISNLTMLQIVDLASNNFSGSLSERCFLTWKAMMANVDASRSEAKHLQFEYLGLSQLYYQDTVTVTLKWIELELVKILTVFTSIDFSDNSFEGDIPEVLGELKSLYVLNLSHNAFSGQIPTSLANLTQLESLDLSHNELTGNIPAGLASLTFLPVLDISFNKLVGMIPRSRQFDTYTNTSYLGNEGLCGAPLSKPCSNTEGPSPTATSANGHPNSGNNIIWNYISAEIGFAFGLGIVIWPLVFWKRWRDWYYHHVDKVLLRILILQGQVRGDPRRRPQRDNRRRLQQ